MEPNALDRLMSGIERLLIDITAPCPYGLPHPATFKEGFFGPLPDEVMERLLAAGFRRCGDTLYRMGCAGCRACVPIRLLPDTVRLSRSQRRVLHRSRDLAVESGPLTMTAEKLDLLAAFLRTRFPHNRSSAEETFRNFFANRLTNTWEVCYRLEGELIGVSVVDLGVRWCNAVYFFFDPAAGKRSPGTFNILYLLDLCRKEGIPFLYLGYLIEAVRAMRYKARFNPHQLLLRGRWTAGGATFHLDNRPIMKNLL